MKGHSITILFNMGFHWACSCGCSSGSYYASKEYAVAAGRRHVRKMAKEPTYR